MRISGRVPAAPTLASAHAAMSAESATLLTVRPRRLPQLRRAGTVAPGAAAIAWGNLLGTPAPSIGDCEALDAMARLRSVAAGHLVFSHGDTSRSLVALLTGDVALGLAQPGGAMRTERMVHGPAWLDASAAWLEEPQVLDAVALTPVEVAELPRASLQSLLDQRPRLAQRLLVSLAGEVRRLTMQAHELMHKDAPARLASWLGQRCQPAVDSPNRAVVRLVERKSDIASQLGMTPETMSRLMRALSDQGVIEVDGYTVQVRDLATLRRLAQS